MSFLQLLSPPAQMWQQVLGHMVSLERFFPRGCTRMRLLQWHLKDRWSPMVDDPLSQEDRWLSGIPLQVPSPVPVIVYRRISVGLGSAPVGSDGLRGFVRGRKRRAHQCVRDEGSVALAAFLPQLSLISGIKAARCLGPCVLWPPRSPCGPNGIRFTCRLGAFWDGRTFWLISSVIPTRFFPRNGPFYRRCSSSLLLEGTPSFHCTCPPFWNHWLGSRMPSSIRGTICPPMPSCHLLF